MLAESGRAGIKTNINRRNKLPCLIFTIIFSPITYQMIVSFSAGIKANPHALPRKIQPVWRYRIDTVSEKVEALNRFSMQISLFPFSASLLKLVSPLKGSAPDISPDQNDTWPFPELKLALIHCPALAPKTKHRPLRPFGSLPVTVAEL